MVEDPFKEGHQVAVLSALNPDVSVIHAQKADRKGNVIIEGCLFHEIEMCRASDKVIVTVEEIVDERQIRNDPARTVIPFVHVTAIVLQPWGAYPTSVYGHYDYDAGHIAHYQSRAREGPEGFAQYLNECVWGVSSFEEYLEKTLSKDESMKLRKRMDLMAKGGGVV